MKAVILAAGRGTRLQPLTNSTPKCLVKINDKYLLEYILNSLQGIANEAVIVIGYLGEQIQDYFKSQYKNIKLTYVIQNEQLGTGHALLCAKKHIECEDKFLVINGDDVYSNDDLKKLIKHNCAILSYASQHPELFGVLVQDEESKKLLEIVEKPKRFISFQVNTGVYVFPKEIFEHKLEKSLRNEYEIIDYINYLINETCYDVEVVQIQKYWVPINNLEQLKDAEDFLRIIKG